MSDSYVLAGWTEDVAWLRAKLPPNAECLCVDQSASEKNPPVNPGSTVAYVFSWATGSSSQLLIAFGWIHFHTHPREEYAVVLGDPNTVRLEFDFARSLRKVAPEWFVRRVWDSCAGQ